MAAAVAEPGGGRWESPVAPTAVLSGELEVAGSSCSTAAGGSSALNCGQHSLVTTTAAA